MVGRFDLQQAWERTHREKPAPGHERPAEELVTFTEHLRQQLPPGALVLDVGCGRGRNTLHLSQMGFKACGCDLSSVVVETARARMQQAGTTADFQVVDLIHLPYPDGLFAAAACVHVLPYHLKPDIARGVRELWRILQPSGWLYVDLLDCDDAEYGCGQELEEHTFLDSSGVPIHFSSRQEIDELLRGFVLERVARLELGARGNRTGWVIWAVKHKERT